MSMDLLIEEIKEKNNPTVVGLDPNLLSIPGFIREKCFEIDGNNLKGAASSILEFNKLLIDKIYDIVPAVKPQSAYYEMYGYYGIEALYETIKYAKEKGLYVILDGKRNDIGSTCEAYAAAYLSKTDACGEKIPAFDADSLTVNGYLGSDGIKPFLIENKSIFVLVKTSNTSSGELQDLVLKDGCKVYERMAGYVEEWGKDSIGKYGYSNVGAVVGATYPEEIRNLREKCKNTFFLVPGYGAQGGSAKDVANAFDKNGLGAIINSSRAIMYAYKKSGADERDFAEYSRDAAIKMRDEIQTFTA